ncbi:hypothetical protein DESUT3_32140 [Desulfuromonas versatilis]|uniref:Uncharacterized protein n=1 Tax=Desulfuromonas versatilis TaxID=2802975 RepID=A0ABM8HW06_9BACT|nr:hypothetical protein [Desulfuromonas versatilis]BCR06145.1 hypothetical protein DESUT3_32140 [Desulfuromonas versatilis]
MNQPTDTDIPKRDPGLKSLRRRRWFLWGTILVYLPAIWTTLELTHSDRAAGKVFAVWLVLVLVASVQAAFARCPACGNHFHMNGFTPLYLRRCLHCGLHISGRVRNKKS